jgi:hypothetical protein
VYASRSARNRVAQHAERTEALYDVTTRAIHVRLIVFIEAAPRRRLGDAGSFYYIDERAMAVIQERPRKKRPIDVRSRH